MRNWNDSLFGTVSIIGKGPVLGFFFWSSFSSSCGSVSMENGKKVKGLKLFPFLSSNGGWIHTERHHSMV